MENEEMMSTDQHEWDGNERRNGADWFQYKHMILADIKGTKDDVKEIKEDVLDIKLALTELKLEIKQVVNKSATTTSSIISTIISIVGGVVIWFLTGMK